MRKKSKKIKKHVRRDKAPGKNRDIIKVMERKAKQFKDEIDKHADYSTIRPCPQCGHQPCDMYCWTPKSGHFQSSIICPECEFTLSSPIVDHYKLSRHDPDWYLHLETELIEKWNKTKRTKSRKVTKQPDPEPLPEDEPPANLDGSEPDEETDVTNIPTQPDSQLLLW